MATFPSTVRFRASDVPAQPSKIVARSEMERGVPKHRRIAADFIVTQTVILLFTSKLELANFKSWFNVTINAGQDWFDWTDLNTGVLTQARIVELGAVVSEDKYLMTQFTQEMKIEWVEAAI